jgi:hypothetical protein
MKTKIPISLLVSLLGNVVATSKRGLVIVNAPHEQTDLPKYLTSPLLNWVYNYGATPSSNAAYPFGNLSFVPMLWGQDNSATFLSTVEAEQNYSYVLTFNEPDMPKSVGGSELSVSDAVTLWDQQIQPLAEKGYKLGAPGGIPTSGDLTIVASTPNGAAWLSSFFSQCTNCTIDFLTAHFYGPAAGLEGYLIALHANYTHLPIWVTEFGYPDQSTSEVVTSLSDSITFLDNATWIQRYAYFCDFRQGEGNSYIGQNGAVWDDNGDITDVGKVWLGLQETPQVAGSQSGGRQMGSSMGILILMVLAGSVLLI